MVIKWTVAFLGQDTHPIHPLSFTRHAMHLFNHHRNKQNISQQKKNQRCLKMDFTFQNKMRSHAFYITALRFQGSKLHHFSLHIGKVHLHGKLHLNRLTNVDNIMKTVKIARTRSLEDHKSNEAFMAN